MEQSKTMHPGFGKNAEEVQKPLTWKVAPSGFGKNAEEVQKPLTWKAAP